MRHNSTEKMRLIDPARVLIPKARSPLSNSVHCPTGASLESKYQFQRMGIDSGKAAIASPVSLAASVRDRIAIARPNP